MGTRGIAVLEREHALAPDVRRARFEHFSFDPVVEPLPYNLLRLSRHTSGLDWDGDPIVAGAQLQARLTGVTLPHRFVFGTSHPSVPVDYE